MIIVYSIINTLILAGLLFVFARKPVVSLFRNRREAINTALDEAEDALNEPEVPLSPVFDDFAETDSLYRQELKDLNDTTEKAVQYIRRTTEEECRELRRDMIEQVEAETIRKLKEETAALFSTEPYCSALRDQEGAMLRSILSMVELTPGDIAYLTEHDVLYVTLTSAFPLSPELVDMVRTHTDAMLAQVGGKTSLWVKEDPQLIGGLRLRIGDTLYDCTVAETLYQLERTVKKSYLSGLETPESMVASMAESIVTMNQQVFTYQRGRVITVSDGICWMDGLADIMYGEVVEFFGGQRGMVLDIQHNRIGCVIYGEYEHIESGTPVRRVGRIASVPVGEDLLGRVVDSLGHPIDGRGRIRSDERRPIECAAPAILDRASVCRPLHTGSKAIDALVPIGRGQRELIIGDRQTGKTSLALDTIINQKGKNVVCIYVAIGQKETTVADIRTKLEKYGAMAYTTIVSAAASKSASLQYIAPFAGTAMGEYFMEKGRDVLIVYDDLSKHAVAYRELSLLLHRPSGREAYPGDIFYLHARLLERSAQLSPEKGGGSMTALPIVETLSGDISSYIPTNVISITDGQIFLDTDLFYEGQRPAVNVGLSVSRVGSAAQTKLMKQVSSSLRMRLAQYRELAGFSQFSADSDAETKKVLDAGSRMMAALRQGRFAPLADWQQALLLYAVAEGFAAAVSPEAMEHFETKLYEYFITQQPALTAVLQTGNKISAETKTALDAALKAYSEVSAWQAPNS